MDKYRKLLEYVDEEHALATTLKEAADMLAGKAASMIVLRVADEQLDSLKGWNKLRPLPVCHDSVRNGVAAGAQSRARRVLMTTQQFMSLLEDMCKNLSLDERGVRLVTANIDKLPWWNLAVDADRKATFTDLPNWRTSNRVVQRLSLHSAEFESFTFTTDNEVSRHMLASYTAPPKLGQRGVKDHWVNLCTATVRVLTLKKMMQHRQWCELEENQRPPLPKDYNHGAPMRIWTDMPMICWMEPLYGDGPNLRDAKRQRKVVGWDGAGWGAVGDTQWSGRGASSSSTRQWWTASDWRSWHRDG